MYKKISLSALVFGALLAMNGCGGGGGDTGSTPVSSQSISGVAVDDLILNGVVKAKDPSGNLLASGRTSDNDGTYKVNVNYTGVLLVNVTCDENSTMYNPDTKIETACGADVNLNSLGTVTAGTDLTLNISPLTEIVYQRAEALAGGDISNVDASDVEDARTEIGLMFSVDPLADDPTADTYADIIGTIHTLADADPSTSVIDITNSLAEELADGEADGTADATLSTLVEVMADENLTNNLVDTNGTYLPPENPAALSDIDEAKALFTELRTQAMSVVDYTNSGTPGFLDTEAASMEVALSDVVLNIDVMGVFLNDLANAISYMQSNNLTTLNDAITETSPGTWEYSMKDENGTEKWSGTVSIPSVLLGNEADAQLYTAGTLTMTVNGTLPLDYIPVVQDGIVDSQSFNGTLTVLKRTGGADITLSGEVASNGTTIQLTEANAELAYTESTADEFGYTEPVFNYFKLHNITMQGIVGGYTIDGSIAVNSYVQNEGLAPKGGIEVIADTYFSGQATCSDGFTSTPYANALVQITLDGVTHDVYTYSDGWYYGMISGAYDINNFENALYAPDALNYVTVNDSVCPTGSTASTFVQWAFTDTYENIANSGWLPNDITFTGAISRTGASIEGTLNAKWLNAKTIDLENSLEVPFVNVTLNGKLQMPERPLMLMSLSFENDATHNTLGASYSYDATVINMSALFDTDMNNGDVVITTHTGLQADINIVDDGITTAVTGTITKDGGLVGTLEERLDVPVVAYTDGSFESLP